MKAAVEMRARRRGTEEAECRKMVRALAGALVRADAGRRREAAAGILATALPSALRALAEALVGRLGGAGGPGAAAALVALGPRVLPALESALAGATERRLLHLAPVAAALGRALPARERTALQMALLTAAGRAPTPESRAALEDAVFGLRDDAGAEPLEPAASARCARRLDRAEADGATDDRSGVGNV